MVVFNPIKEKVMERGIELLNVSSNNEAEYATLIEGLEWCISNGINCVNIFGDYAFCEASSGHMVLQK